ncbi:ABC transporter ATP-binding protein [Alkaliphilus pronyensis]|uniref:ABC-type quaternary amine transporter n=1 Tax=Alkaliphilus pronyensis TaxID=1482732 RepID=A0A6I0FBH2_9FIRM|nr:ABC transporter ATP-binding protein [Alkaliphilus pronyensis]KAB3535315.1 ABC transporter ATP-binding protein [Alkaliphilus pronyensis]
MAIIYLKNINKSYDNKVVLKDINLIINEGQLVVLLGPSGSGKTTLLHGIAGMIDFDQGDIFFGDQLMNHVSIDKRNAVLVDQNLLLFPHMTVESNIAFGLKMRRVKKSVIKQKVDELIRLLELEGHEKKYPNELSGGQMQRVAIARALAIEPEVLLLDEPFSKLDIMLRKNMQEFVRALQKKLNITLIMVTHDQEEALSMADQVALLLYGEIKQYASPNEIYEKPVSKEVADFFGVRNYFEGKIIDGEFHSPLGRFSTHLSDCEKITFMFRPEQISFGEKQKDSIEGIVKRRVYSGDKVMYTIDVRDFEIYVSSFIHKDFKVGEEVALQANFDKAVYFI